MRGDTQFKVRQCHVVHFQRVRVLVDVRHAILVVPSDPRLAVKVQLGVEPIAFVCEGTVFPVGSVVTASRPPTGVLIQVTLLLLLARAL